MAMRWVLRDIAHDSAQRLSQALGVSPLIARLLLLRGLAEPEAAGRFLRADLAHLHDPFRMLGMEAAVRRIFQALERKDKILIYGDYDVDGAMAVVILHTALKLLGAEVHHYIPDRFRDGYGMREEVVEQARERQFSLLISVDTGIRAFGVVERARELGLDCIITDHHLPGGAPSDSPSEVPRALAVLNPKQPQCSYPDKNLCGAGVALKLAQALLERHPSQSARSGRLLLSFMKPACIGTIADSVPLLGENRVIARLGLAGLNTPVNPGLKALVEAAGLGGRDITAWDVGFRLAPRLNAAGRMESAQDVIELLTLADPARARELALKLNRLNSERQSAEQQILEEIEEQYRQNPQAFSDACLVLDGHGWHRGVIGIVASRVVDRFHRPALVISCEDGAGHGSGRSSETFHLLNALTACGDLFARFGGHAQAAGFVLPAERIVELRRRLNEYAARHLRPEDLIPQLAVDAEVSFADLSPALLEELEQLAPFGCGNPRPVFCARGVRLHGPPRVLQEKHLKMRVVQQNRTFEAVAWRKATLLPTLLHPDPTLDLAFHLDQNHYQGRTTLQLELMDWRSA
jgi:single-stranded-DNA-specific exonuclease